MKQPIDEPLYTEREVISLLEQCLPRGVLDGVCSHLSYMLREYQSKRYYNSPTYKFNKYDDYLTMGNGVYDQYGLGGARKKPTASGGGATIVDIDVIDDSMETKNKLYVVYAPDGEGEYNNWGAVSELFKETGWVANWIGDEQFMPHDKNIKWQPDDDVG